MPGRPREFDLDEVLDRTMHAFWLRGYHATTLADLMQATCLQKGSIYKAFADKHDLFIAALDRYLAMVAQSVEQILAGGATPRDAVEGLLTAVIDMTASADHRGCLAVNSLVELAPTDAMVARRLHAHFASLNAALARTLGRGQAQGQFRSDRTADELAGVLGTLIAGLSANIKGGVPPAHAADIARSTLVLLTA